MLLYFVRHADPTYTPDALTPLGHRQAEAVARRVCRYGLDRVFTSPLVRAQQTAKPTCELMKLEPQIEEWTSEALAWDDFKVDDGNGHHRWCCARQWSDFKTPEMVALTPDNWYDCEICKGTNAREGFARIVRGSDDFFRRLGYERDGANYRIITPSEERIALFAHAGFGVIWLAHMFNLIPPQTWGTFDIAHSSVTIFEFKNYPNGITTPYCLSLGDMSHIYRENLPMNYNNRIRV